MQISVSVEEPKLSEALINNTFIWTTTVYAGAFSNVVFQPDYNRGLCRFQQSVHVAPGISSTSEEIHL